MSGGDRLVNLSSEELIVYKLSPRSSLEQGFSGMEGATCARGTDGEIQALSKDGRLKATGDDQGHFDVVDASTGATLASFESATSLGQDDSGRRIECAWFSADSRRLFVHGGGDNYGEDTDIYDPLTGRMIYDRFGPGQEGCPSCSDKPDAVKAELPDRNSVLLQSGKTVRLHMADGPMPEGFAEFAESVVGAYIDERGIYRVLGTTGSRPIQKPADLLSRLDPESRWSEFASRRFSAPAQGSSPSPSAVPAAQTVQPRQRLVLHEAPGDGGFVDNGDGTITDMRTGLMWEKKSADGSVHDQGNEFTWSTGTNSMDGTMVTTFLAALNAGSGFAGHTDWRIPSIEELVSLKN